MFKRTKGYLLLTLLVLTGFAGRIHSDSLTGKERKFVVNHLKESKTAFLKSVKGLSEAQLNYKPAPDKWSVKECIYHITLAENNLWTMAEAELKKPTNPEKRSEIKVDDVALVKMMTDRTSKFQAPETFKPEQAKWPSANEALVDFKEKRANLLKFAKTTTDDLRNHVRQAPWGYMDSYQAVLMISAHTMRHTQQIEEIKAGPGFPK